MTNSWAPSEASSDPTQKLVRGRGLNQFRACLRSFGLQKTRNNFIKITLS